MFPAQTILHPTDFSEPSAAALQVACSLARDHNARLVLLHVASMTDVYGGVMPYAPIDPGSYLQDLERRLGQIQVPRAVPPVAQGAPESPVVVERQLREGDAAAEILQTAEDVGADLIVMGTHGRSGLGRVLLGSVAAAVLRGARCPVLTVKSPAPATEPATESALLTPSAAP